jgi:hypothetical protein
MYRTKTAVLGLTFLALSPAAWAQPGAVSGPTAGLVFDAASRAVRPILGVPGASLLGDPVIASDGLTEARISPRQDSALLITRDGAGFVRIDGGSATPLACEGLFAAPERVVYSPSGDAAALYAAGRVQLVSGLPGAPKITGELKLLIAQRGGSRFNRRSGAREIASFAVSDDGRFILAAGQGAIQVLGAGGENFTLIPSAAGASVAFAPGGHDAAVADPANLGVLWFGDVAGGAAQRRLAEPAAEAAAAAGLAFSSDGRKVYVASGRQVTAFDLTAGGQSSIACDFQPSGLYPMGGFFRLNEPGAAPLWLLDARTSEPHVFFVPVRSE